MTKNPTEIDLKVGDVFLMAHNKLIESIVEKTGKAVRCQYQGCYIHPNGDKILKLGILIP
jgi:hypothetical protein